MKQFNFKKSFLTLVAMLCALVANATIGDIQEAGFQPAGAAFGGTNGTSVSIDFEKEAVKAVVDLTGCQTHVEGTVETPETILSFGAKITAANYGMSGGVIHVFYYAGEKKLQVAWNSSSSSLYVGEQTLDDVSAVTIELSKTLGLTVNGKVWGADEKTDGTSESVGATPLLNDGNYGMSILNLTSLFVGSAYGEHSNATYTQLAVVDASEITGGTDPDTPDVEEPKTFTVNGVTSYLDAEKTNSETWKVAVPVDFEAGDSLEVVFDLTNSTASTATNGDEDVISFGETLDQWSGNNLHFWYFGTTSGSLRAEVPSGYRNDHSGVYGEHKVAITKNGLFFDGELWTGTSMNNSSVTKCDAEALSNLLTLKELQVGVYEKPKNSVIKSIKVYGTKTVTADTLSLSTDTLIEDYTPKAENGNLFTVVVDSIDFTHQTLKAVIDLSTCTDNNEEVLTIGEKTDSRDANWVRLNYSPSTKNLKAQARVLVYGSTYATLGPIDTTFVETPTDLTLELHANKGLLMNGEVLQGIDPNGDDMGGGANIAFTAENLEGLVALKKVELNSIYDEVRSHATYKLIEIINDPDTITLPVSDYTAKEACQKKFIGETDIDFAHQSLKAVIDLTNCSSDIMGSFENVLSIGENIETETGNAVHLNFNGFYGGAANYYASDDAEVVTKTWNAGSSKEVTVELSQSAGLVFTNADTTFTLLEPEQLTSLLALTHIQVGSLMEKTGILRSGATYKSIEVVTLPVAKPEAIPFDLTEWGGWIDEGDTFAWDSDIDWTKQALEVVVDLSSCNSTSNQNIVSIAGTEDDLAHWGADNDTYKEAGHIHFYYTKSTKKMEVNYLTADGNIYRNGNYSLFKGDATNDTILVSMDGVAVNGTIWNGTSEYGDYTSFDQTTISPLMSLNHIWVGSTQGDGRSWATYKSIKLIDYDAKANGISNVEHKTETSSYNVYNLSGQMVKSNAQDLNGLPKGLYIVNGKKMILK